MSEHGYTKRNATTKAPDQSGIAWQRPFQSSLTETEADSQPDLQTQLEAAQRSQVNWSQMKVGGTPSVVQTKLKVGAPGDQYEQEADRVAAQVMRMEAPELPREEQTEEEEVQTKPLAKTVTPLVQREAEPEEEDPIQTKPDGLLQREEGSDEEEAVQMQPLPIQREEMPEEEESLQAKLEAGQDNLEEESPVQAKANGLLQREALEDEESVQPLSIQRETAPIEDEEPGHMQQAESSDEEIQTKRSPTADLQRSTSSGLESQLSQTKGGGSPLSDDVRSFMESRFNTDFSHVRVHTGSSAVQMNKELNAQAFTHGSDVYFGAGKSPGQNELTAHELTHVVQQTGTKTLQRKSVRALKPQKDVLRAKISVAAATTIQRKSAPKSAQTDPSFQSVVKRTKEVAKQQKSHPPAKTKATEAQAAAVPPSNEKESKAQNRQVQEMNQQQPGQFDAAKFKAAVLEKINAATPQTLDAADKFKNNNLLGAVKSDLSSQVGNEKKQAAGAIEEKTKEPPKTGGIPEKTVTPLPPSPPGTPPTDIGASQAAPKPKDASEVSMQEGSKSLDQQMTDAKVTEEQLEKSNEPEFQTALGAKREAQTNAATAPAEYRQHEQATLAQAQVQAHASAQAPLQGMQAQKVQALSQVTGQQGTTKGQDEQKRSEIAGRIEGIYNNTKQKVETLLSSLDGEVNQAFDRGADAAKAQFEAFLSQRMQKYKEQRYSGVEGAARWVKDAIFGMPPEVNAFYQEGRKQYIEGMTATIDRVANLVVTKLNVAKSEIARGKQEIEKYVASLDPLLRQLGQDAAQAIQGKFDQLEQSVDNKQNELIDSLAQKYNENLQALDADIEKLKAENQGLVGKAKEAMGGVLQTILELKNMLMGMLAKAAGAVEKIIKDPIAFLGNLVAGIKQGFMGFVGNITTHLKKGLMGWLTGALSGAGVEMPKSFDLKGIFTLVMNLLGMTYQGMRARVANKVGEKKVSALEKGFDMFILWKNEGAAGLWKFIQDKLANLKEMVIGGIQSFVIDSIINAGVTWVLSLLNPASAFVRACKLIIDVIMFFVERGSQIADLVNAVLDSVGAIADGAINVAAKLVEGALAKALPVVIGFLASLIGLGGISGKIRGLLEKARGLIDTAVNWVLSKAISFVSKLGFGKGKGRRNPGSNDAPDQRTPQQKKDDLHKAISQSEKLLEKEDIDTESIRKALPAIKERYRLTALELVLEGDTIFIKGKVNPDESTPRRKIPKVDLSSLSGWRPKWRESTNKALDYYKIKEKSESAVDRRHIVAFEVIVKDLRSRIELKTHREASGILAGMGYKPDKEKNSEILEAAKKYLRDKFNDHENVWVGDSKENQDRGRIIAQKLSKLEQLQSQLRKVQSESRSLPKKLKAAKIQEGSEITSKITEVAEQLRDARLDLPTQGTVKAAKAIYKAMLDEQRKRDLAG